MLKSIVAAYVGARGSGKTLGMSIEAVFYMLAGKTVISNYPVKFSFQDEDGQVRHYESIPLDMQALVTFDKSIKDGIILLDEFNLWCNSRTSGTIANRLLSIIFQMIRKRHLSVYIACQDFRTLDKNIRFQTDIICECFDLSFRYPNLKPGTHISQMITDYSGIVTGRALYKGDDAFAWQRNTKTRILHAYKFWNVYETYTEFDPFAAMTKYTMKPKQMVINVNDDGGYRGVEAEETVKMMMREFREAYPEKTTFPAEEMSEMMASYGVEGDPRMLGKLLKKVGFNYKQTRKGNVYVLGENNENKSTED